MGIPIDASPTAGSSDGLTLFSSPGGIVNIIISCYAEAMKMNSSFQSLQLLSEQQMSAKRLIAVLAPHAAREHMLALAARLARSRPLLVLDAGNRFNAYRVAHFLRELGIDGFREGLERIRVARAFTPYQVLALLEATDSTSYATLVLDLLNTFYDESLPHAERKRLLFRSVAHLRRLSAQAIVVVSVRPPPPPHQDPQGLVQIIQEAADETLFFEELQPPKQLTLF
jgi:hypothetical protein